MDNHQDETTTFEVTLTGDGVSTSGISSPQVVLDTTNTLSWGINECSSSFQSVSSCETLESYEPNATTTAESPQVIVVPFIAGDSEMSGGTVLANNGVHIPLIKECSIRIDQLKMAPATHCEDDRNVEKIIELPFSTNGPCDDSAVKNQSFCLSDDESTAFEGFGVESLISTEYDLYKNAADLIKENADRVTTNPTEPILIEHHSNDVIIINDPILTERILTERHLSDRITKTKTVKRPRQNQRKVAKTPVNVANNQSESINQSRIEIVEIDVSESQPNNVVKPVVHATDRITSTPVQNVDVTSGKRNDNSSSDSSDSDVIVAPLDESETKKKVDHSADIRNNNKQKEKELRRAEKMRKRKELSQIAERIRDHWRETFAAARRKQRKKEKKNKYKNYHPKIDHSHHHHKHGKQKRISCSSDSDSTDSSSSSRTSDSSSLTDSESYDSDTTTSYTSQTSHTRTESDSTDDDSDSSDSSHHRSYKHRRLYRRRRSPSSDTSDTSSTDDDDDYETTCDNRRKFHLLKKAIYRKQFKSKSDESSTRSRKRKTSDSRRSETAMPKKRKLKKNANRSRDDSNKTMKNRTTSGHQQNQQQQHKFDYSSRSSSSAKVRRTKPTPARRSRIESTSAGDFSVKQCDFE